jgi:uncharacterized protein YcbX
MALRLTGINRYPVKSCRGEALESATVEPWGLAGDRRWMIVDDTGNAVTAREHPQLLRVRPQLVTDGVLLRGPDLDDLVVRKPRGSLAEVTLFHRRPFAAAVADDAAHAWVSKAVGMPCRLIYQDDPTRRPTNPDVGDESDRVSLADGYPLLLTTEESLGRLNELIAEGAMSDVEALPMVRFRPNVVIAGAVPWAEDGWRRLRIGAAKFRAVKGCDRCVLTTIDPDTGLKGKEPIATLARHRKWDGATWFGMNLVPDSPGVMITVGDDVQIVDSVPAPNGPPR